MAVIVEQLYYSPTGGSKNQPGIRLLNEEFIRPMSFGDNWTKLRIGVLLGVGNTRLCSGLVDIGVCSGTRRGVGSGNPVNYVGGGWGGGNTGRVTQGNAPTYPQGMSFTNTAGFAWSDGQRFIASQSATTAIGYRQQASAWTIYGPNGTPSTSGRVKRGLVLVDLWRRGSNSITILVWMGNTADNTGGGAAGDGVYAQCDYSVASLMAGMECGWYVGTGGYPVAGAIGGTGFLNGGAGIETLNMSTGVVSNNVIGLLTTALDWTVAYQPLSGPLNSVNIAWNLASVPCTLWAVAVSKYE